jgi:hypothetical protein
MCLLKAMIAEPEEMAADRQWLCKYASTATKYTCNNKRTVVGGVFCLVCQEAI